MRSLSRTGKVADEVTQAFPINSSRFERYSSLSFLINTHVINLVLLWENCIVDPLLPSPGSANCQIENQKLLLVKRPGVTAALLIRVGKVFLVIQEKIQVFRIPFERIYV